MKKADSKRLYRSQRDTIIAGVAAGIADYTAIDASIVRILFIVTTFFSGFGLLAYIILWIILPVEKKDTIATETTVKQNFAEIREKATNFAKEFQTNQQGSGRGIVAIILIAIGAILILKNLNLFNENFFWPILLIVIGLVILLPHK